MTTVAKRHLYYSMTVLAMWALLGCQNAYPPPLALAPHTNALASHANTVVHFDQQAIALNGHEEQTLLDAVDAQSKQPIVLQVAPAPGNDKMQSMHLAFKRGEACRQRLLDLDPKRSIQVHYAPRLPINTLTITEDRIQHAN